MKYGRKVNLSTKTCVDISELEKKTREIAQNAKSCSERKKLLEIREVAKKIVKQPVENRNFKYSLQVNKKQFG